MKPASMVPTTTLLQRVGEAGKLGIVVELGAVLEPSGPGENGSRGVGRGRSSLLMLPVVASDGAVRGLGEHRLAVRRHQHAGHQPERAEALRHRVGLHVAVVVLASPDIAAGPISGTPPPCRRSAGARRSVRARSNASAVNSVANTSAKRSLKRPS